MKIGTALAALTLAALPGAALAQPGGFHPADSLPVTSATDARQLPDDTVVRLRGRIVRALGGDDYEFRDDSGMVVVEIDDDVWYGVDVRPDDRVELVGDVDRSWLDTRTEVDVRSIDVVG